MAFIERRVTSRRALYMNIHLVLKIVYKFSCLNAPGVVIVFNVRQKISCLGAPGVDKVSKIIYKFSCFNAPGALRPLILYISFKTLTTLGPGPGAL